MVKTTQVFDLLVGGVASFAVDLGHTLVRHLGHLASDKVQIADRLCMM